VTRALAILILIAACGGAKQPAKPAPQSSHEETVAFLRKLADRACACKDATCARAIDGEIEAQMREEIASGEADEAPAPEEADQRRMNEQLGRLVRCLTAQDVPMNALGVYAEWELGMIKDRACKCTDAACAKKSASDWDEALAKFAKFPGSERTIENIKKISDAAQVCFLDGHKLLLQEVVLELKALRKRACECPDDACRQEVRAGFDAWIEANRETQGDQSTADQITEIARELAACMAPRPDEANAAE